jgi:Flp pilus assembly protein TadD
MGTILLGRAGARWIVLAFALCQAARLLPAQVDDAGAPDAAFAQNTVPSEVLRHPLPPRARSMLQDALSAMKSGEHQQAIQQLLKTLTKFPSAAGWIHSLLGVEYLKVDRCGDAVKSFEQAVLLFHHDAVNQANLGLSLVCAGDYGRAEPEIRRALQLDPTDTRMKLLLQALLKQKER